MKSLRALYRIGVGPSSSHTMGPERVDSSASTDRLIVTGDTLALLENRRAARFLKDNTDYTLEGDTMTLSGHLGSELNGGLVCKRAD